MKDAPVTEVGAGITSDRNPLKAPRALLSPHLRCMCHRLFFNSFSSINYLFPPAASHPESIFCPELSPFLQLSCSSELVLHIVCIGRTVVHYIPGVCAACTMSQDLLIEGRCFTLGGTSRH